MDILPSLSGCWGISHFLTLCQISLLHPQSWPFFLFWSGSKGNFVFGPLTHCIVMIQSCLDIWKTFIGNASFSYLLIMSTVAFPRSLLLVCFLQIEGNFITRLDKVCCFMVVQVTLVANEPAWIWGSLNILYMVGGKPSILLCRQLNTLTAQCFVLVLVGFT